MSDFLTRIAQVSRREAALVGAKVPGLFTPMEAPGDVETITSAVARQGGPGKTRPEAAPPAVPHVATVDTESQAPKLVAADTTQTSASEPWARSIDENESQPAPSARSTHDKPNSMDAAQQPPAISQQAALSSRPEIDRRQGESPRSLADIIEAVARTDVDAAFSEDIDLDGSRKQVIPQSPPLVPGTNIPKETPRAHTAELSDLVEQHSKQAPTVHINIGRVEVRAQTMAPASPPRREHPKARSSLSLNDYLKRDGGRS